MDIAGMSLARVRAVTLDKRHATLLGMILALILLSYAISIPDRLA
jgi:hypothetical protein